MTQFRHMLRFFPFFSLVGILSFYQFMGYKLRREQSSAVDHFEDVDVFDSTCSKASDRRGSHQKVIAYSIYGDLSREEVDHKYLKPFKETLQKIPAIYPGWIVRIYHNLSREVASWKILESTLDLGSHIDLCNATKITENLKTGKLFEMTWRWLPLIDDMVDTFMSRDSDSRIIHREEAAVREWLAADRIFHVMRDHPHHCTPMLGGMWGVKISQNRSTFAQQFKKIFAANHLHKYDYDQLLLREYIWPIAQTSLVAHDSYCCEHFPLSQPFPTPRKYGLFVGGRDLAEENLKFPCPQQCRPVDVGSDWSFC